METKCFRVGEFEVRLGERRVMAQSRPLTLGTRAFDVLLVLIRHHGQVAAKDTLMAEVWPGVVVEENNLTTQISALRKVLGADAVVTVSGRGYQLGLPVCPIEDDAGSAPPRVPVPAIPARSPALPNPPPTAPEQPSLAVMPFVNLSGDPGQDYFVDGVVEDLTNALSRIRRFFVIARSSSFTYKGRPVNATLVGHELGVRYVLEGSYRQAAARVRIGVQLVESGEGRQLWSQRFEGKLEDIFALQDDITARVVAAIEPTLVLAEIERASRKPTENLQAYDLCLRAWPLAMRGASMDHVTEAVALLQRAIGIDPGYSYAKALLAAAHVLANQNGWMTYEQAEVALSYAEQAHRDHHDDPTTLALAGQTFPLFGRHHAAARSAVDHALALNPSSVLALRTAGYVYAYVGEAERSIEYFERAMRLNPLDPEVAYTLGGLAFALIHAGRPEEAVNLARRAVVEQPQWGAGRSALIYALAACGRWDEVRVAAGSPVRLRRYPTITAYERHSPWTSPSFRALAIETLRRLGVPE